jgi:hypothetical protein
MISVSDSYSHLSISQKDGSIVFGREPEYEEIEKVADSFDDLMDGLLKLDSRFLGWF